MLHLRVISPAEKTSQAIEFLDSQEGVAHVIVHAGAARSPVGDLIEADIARESVDSVISGLEELDLDHQGGMTLETLDTTMSDLADRAQKDAPGESANAIVWQELVSKTGDESRFNATFLAFLSIACLLAAIGVVSDSAVTIVGAMVVGPEFGPLAGIAAGLVLRRSDLVRRASLALAVGFPIAMLVTAGAVLLGRSTGLITDVTLKGNSEVDFIYQVGPFSFIIALLAGAAGMLSMISAKSAALVGVFISVTTVPAAGYAVVAAVLGEWAQFRGSVIQLVVNLAGIVLAAALVLLIHRRGKRTKTANRPLIQG